MVTFLKCHISGFYCILYCPSIHRRHPASSGVIRRYPAGVQPIKQRHTGYLFSLFLFPTHPFSKKNLYRVKFPPLLSTKPLSSAPSWEIDAVSLPHFIQKKIFLTKLKGHPNLFVTGEFLYNQCRNNEENTEDLFLYRRIFV